MKRFTAEQLERATDLYEHVEANRWDMATMSKEDCQLQCEFWVFKARALPEQDRLPEHDQLACIWVLGVVLAIATQQRVYVYGLSRDHSDDWSARARSTATRILARRKRAETASTRKPQARQAQDSAPEPPPHLPGLAGATIVVMGGEPDTTLLERFRDADFRLDWTPSNIRQVQSVVERIKLGKVDGVIFLADLNRHVNFFLVRDACRLSSTPLTLATRGLAAMRRALEQLNEQRARLPESA